jgi:CubicO group peptidase (beta-lactamase class C family)
MEISRSEARRLIAVALSLAVTTTIAAQGAGWNAFVAGYRAALPAHAIVGSSAALVENGVVTAKEHYGLRDKAAGLPVDDDTIFHWASITKTFGAIAIMQLRDRGLIGLDEPIVKYVPELRQAHNRFGAM